MVSKLHELAESALSSGKASISVVLVLGAGYFLRKTGRISKDAEANISKLGKLWHGLRPRRLRLRGPRG